MMYLYILFTSVIYPIVSLFSLFNKKLKSRFQNEQKQYKKALEKIRLNNKRVIWIHAASGGEFEQVVPILEEIDRTKYFILLSFMSPTIFNIQKNTQLADATIYHQLDFYWSAKKFLLDFKPEFYILNRHDIWPNHIYLASKMKIKIFFLNCNIHLKSNRFIWILKPFNKLIFNKFDKIYTGTDRLKSAISNLTEIENIKIMGDTRFNRVINRMQNNENNFLPKKFNKTKNIILGSVIESDFEVIFGGINKKFPNGETDLIKKNTGLIITPHDIDKSTINQIKKILYKYNICYRLYSELNDINSDFIMSTIIIDTVGILPDLYKYGRLSYIGAGFGAGVHNVLEPAVYGCSISFGPNIHILDEAIEMEKNGLGIIINNISDFYQFLHILENDKKYFETKERLISFVKNNICDVKSILNDILNEN